MQDELYAGGGAMTEAPRTIAGKLGTAFEDGDDDLFASLLDPAVRWGGEEDTPETCHTREQVLARYRQLRDGGVGATVEETICLDDAVVLGLALSVPDDGPNPDLPPRVYQVFRLADSLVVDIRGFPTREEALAQAAG
ncbi:MAG TPA: nuclear transport factor 2 family protein [Solirubrobacterales bacterium]|jgi:hypothetical protein